MAITREEVEALLLSREDEHLEVKEARNRFDFEKLVKYCAALANEGGGHIVLGVTDARPRQVVGTRAFEPVERTKAGLVERLRLRIDVDELPHPDGRIVVFTVPPRPIGYPIAYEGAYWMRGGEDLVPMTPDLLQRIFAETQPDFSAQTCSAATVDDLSPEAIATFRDRWARKSRRNDLRDLAVPQLLADAELVIDKQVTYAALILLGTRQALGRHLAQAEVIFEYRSDEASIEYQERLEHRQGFLLFHDTLWSAVNVRNDVYSYQAGLFRYEIRAFNEAAVREAILNAVSHRDYRLAGSTFVRQWPQRIQVVSPGGFPAGVTAENILLRQAPRNRRLADALGRCGLVERSGQGADRMFSTAVQEGKRPPDFSESDDYQVSVSLEGQVRDPRFLAFLERVGRETQHPLGIEDLLVLDAVHRGTQVPQRLQPRVAALVQAGVLERPSARRLMLSRRLYDFLGRRAGHTHRRGLDRAASKALLIQHLQAFAAAGSPLRELAQVLPGMTTAQVQNLLRELQEDGLAHPVGRTRAALWFPGPRLDPSNDGHGG